MNGGKECDGGEMEGQPSLAQVPIGWKRKVDPTGVLYISPSGSVLSSLEQVKSYLLTDGTCKCGLECPLILPKVFNFDPGAAVKQRTAEDVKADEDVTKLCIHKRKLIAVATLHKSMEMPHPPLGLTSPGGATGPAAGGATRSATPRAIRNKSHEGLSGPGQAPDCKNPFKMMMAAGARPYPHPHPQDMSAVHHHQLQLQLQHQQQQQQELYAGYQRQRLASGEPGPKSPYRAGGHHHAGMLSPTSSGSQVYGDSPLSPRTDPLGSPDAFARAGANPCAFQGGSSPIPIHGGNSRTPLSPPGVMLHGSPASQASCVMAGRTNTPLSPPNVNKSPIMKKPMCNFPPGMDMPRAVFHHGKGQPAPHPPPTPPAMPSACILQKKPLSSEKDPLGILDPIPSKPVNPNPMANPNSGFPPGVHSQVPMMNVNIPPAIVPLPSNLPLPTVKPGPVGHGGHLQRTQPTSAAATSISPSPVTSPVHMAAPPPHGRLESSPQRSRSSSTSSDHGSFAMPSGPQVPCGSIKVPPRSPRSSLGSPRPAMPSSPSSAKPDALHQYKDMPNQLLAGMGNSLGAQHNPMFPPPTSVASASCGTSGGSGGSGAAGGSGGGNTQKNHPGLLGMPLNQILNQHNAASFPASSLLSAAAKAQLANQNKMGGGSGGGAGMGSNGGGAGGGTGGGGGHPCGKGVDGHSTLNPMLPPPNSAMLLNSVGGESGQSGRAALRDKLMAQQRDPLRKRKQPGGGGGGSGGGSSSAGSSHHDSMVFSMLKPEMAGHPRMPSGPPPPPEQMRKAPSRLTGLPPNTSMAQLLQSMSSQNSHMVQNVRMGPGPGLGPGPGPGPAQMHFGDGVMSGGPGHQNLQAQQRLHGPGDGMRCPSMSVPGQGPQMPYGGGMMNQIQASAMGGGGGPMGQGGQHPMNNPSMNHLSAHPQQLSYLQHQQQQQQQQGHPLSHGRANVSGMMLSSNDGSCGQAISEPGDGSSMNCMPNPQMSGLQAHVNTSSHMYPPQATLQQQHAQQQSLHPGLQSMHGGPPAFQGQHVYQENLYMDGSSSNSMACLYQNYQQPHPQMSSQPLSSLPEEDPGMQHSLQQQYQAAHHHHQQQQQHLQHQQQQQHHQQQQQQQQHHQQQHHHQQALRDMKAQNHESMSSTGTSGGGGNGGPESVDAIYRAVVDAASKGVHVTITTATAGGGTQASPVTVLSAMSAFTASIGEPHGPAGLQQHHPGNVNAAAAAAMHGQQGEPSVTANPTARGPGARQPRPGRPRKNSEQGRSPPEAADVVPHEYFRSPSGGSGGGGTPRGQWDGLDTVGQTQWQGGGGGGGGAGEEFLECSTHVRSSPAQPPSTIADGGPHDVGLQSDRSSASYLEESFRFSGGGGGQRTPINFKERLEQTVERCAHMNGGGPPVPTGRVVYSDPLGPPRHELTGDDQSPSSSTSLEGPLAKDYGHYNGHYNGHCAPSPSDTRSLSSEEELRHPDSPAPELLHYRQRAFSMGELVWSQIKGFPPWPAKLAGAEEQLHKPTMQMSEPGKVEPEKLKTLTQDLEALERVAKMNRKSGKLNNHLEAAIQEAMSELDKISTVHQIPTRDRQVRLPKPKRRKISR
ncbi:methyl-CpG-binding domain protein 5-like isoform X1 [Alosa sapidissima]|uniref:methyl-CpG-binding domain protein 5-like isoform X1 n=1 Tax=Alosa sapidissima TaxID=34773 RepID=UPI001C090E12|nr:methyl-CpG-binding domain protein 5-like isoform X1 [Alosa sapidissima]XP_041937251.1 methyl-CpG-binding domain protein 5-like isoform X1 [Alosa sapidissima]